uniref:Uncharacterized protein n=1 Tax=Arundo donax TaxID=35708 RepID=A0A0A8Z7L0_ARUDO
MLQFKLRILPIYKGLARFLLPGMKYPFFWKLTTVSASFYGVLNHLCKVRKYMIYEKAKRQTLDA